MSGRPAAPNVIVGAGLTGLSAAYQASRSGDSRPILVLERDDRVGGKAITHRRDGHAFDATGHWLHLRDPRIRALIDELFSPGDLVEIERRTGIYSQGVILPYPLQANLHGLPLPAVQACLVDFIEARVRAALAPTEPATFADFVQARFGRAMAELFFLPYNRKLWGEHFETLTPDAVARFVPQPDVHQVVGGAIGLRQEGLGYNARFLYPRQGGIDALPEALARAALASGRVELRRGCAVRAVDPDARTLTLQDGTTLSYAQLVSTIPLPRLVDRIPTAPPEVRAARDRLHALRWRYLDLATRTRPPLREHWVYVPDPGIPFFRVGVYSNASPAMAPPGRASLYVELTDRTHPPDLPLVYDHLAAMGAITAPRDVVFAEVRDIDDAYVVFDADHGPATALLHRWLAARDIRSCGRYGAWVYNSMQDCMVEGLEAAAWLTSS